MTNEARQYQVDKGHFYYATNKRTGQRFKFGFVDNRITSSRTTQFAHGFYDGRNECVIETVEKVDINKKDTLELEGFGFGQVEKTEAFAFNLVQARFVDARYVEYITKITIVGAGNGNV